MKLTQEQRVVGQLKEAGYISRNQCLNNYISRLSAIIVTLKRKGWEFKPMNVDSDYIYQVIKMPEDSV